MKRPSKKKNNPANSPDGTPADDRHLIDAEESLELSVEDKISLYWQENKSFIIGCFSVLVIILVGMNGMKMYSASQLEKLQDSYASAATEGTLVDFCPRSFRDNTRWICRSHASKPRLLRRKFR